jgi:hypothetical protein
LLLGVAPGAETDHITGMTKTSPAAVADDDSLRAEWPLTPFATLGSAVRARGIERELGGRLSKAVKKCIKAEPGRVTLIMPASDEDVFKSLSAKVSKKLVGIETLPILPREARTY